MRARTLWSRWAPACYWEEEPWTDPVPDLEPGGTASMCYNCGCQMPDNDMGKATSITNKTIEAAAKAEGQSVEEARRNALDLLKKVLGEKPSKVGKNQGFDK